jgi:hypothetical protein
MNQSDKTAPEQKMLVAAADFVIYVFISTSECQTKPILNWGVVDTLASGVRIRTFSTSTKSAYQECSAPVSKYLYVYLDLT